MNAPNDRSYIEKVSFPDGPRDVRVTAVSREAYDLDNNRFTAPPPAWKPAWGEILPDWQVLEVVGEVEGCRYVAVRQRR